MLTIGEAREQWGRDVMALVEDFANNMKHEDAPFYIVYACKPDPRDETKFYQAIKAYRARPPVMFGILVWYVDNKLGKFEFVPELSAPPDVPLDGLLLSNKSADMNPQVAQQGHNLNALLA